MGYGKGLLLRTKDVYTSFNSTISIHLSINHLYRILHSGHFHTRSMNLFLRPPLLQPHHHTETPESSCISTPSKGDQAPVLLFAAMEDLARNGNTCQCPAKAISHCSTSKRPTKSKRKEGRYVPEADNRINGRIITPITLYRTKLAHTNRNQTDITPAGKPEHNGEDNDGNHVPGCRHPDCKHGDQT